MCMYVSDRGSVIQHILCLHTERTCGDVPRVADAAVAVVFPQNNPCQQMVIFLRDTSAADLTAIIEFMYKGCVNVTQTQLASFIKTAEMLQIKGLSGDDDKVRALRTLANGHSLQAENTGSQSPI